MPYWKRAVRRVAAFAFVISATTLPAARSQSPSAAWSRNSVAHHREIQRIESRVVDLPMGAGEPRLRLDLKRLMDVYRVPGLSIAVIDGFKIVWAKAYGVIQAGSATAVTSSTLFQAGSISKPVTATGTLRLVQEGRLFLDEDVNRQLRSWSVPNNDFTRTEKVTLRRLLSHTAGVNIGGFQGYDVGAPRPTLLQILAGEKPANTPPVEVTEVPGTRVKYSGGGITVEQLLMTDVTGKAFPELMRELVLSKIEMTDSSFDQPLPPARAALAATGTRADGTMVQGRWRVYPEMAAAGLWTTPSDLAKFAIEIALSWHGRSNRILSEKMTRQMLTPVMEDACLGFFVDPNGLFGHNGGNEGFRALLWMNRESGKGAVIMANSDSGNAAGDLLLHRIAREYGWDFRDPEQETFGALMLGAKLRGAAAALQEYAELKKLGDGMYKVDEGTLPRLGRALLNSGSEKDAIIVLRQNVTEFPKSANAYVILGDAYAKIGRDDLAVGNFRVALEIDPKNQRAADALKQRTKAP